MSSITPSILQQTIDWQHYYALCKQYVEGYDKPLIYQDEKMLRYTASNIKRMDAILQYITIESKLYNLLQSVSTRWTWLVLAEPWCGDVAQILPVLYTIASCTDSIDFKILQSDSHPQILDQYMTEQSRSIPILLCLATDTLQEIGRWGPRPAALQVLVAHYKDDTTVSYRDKVRRVHSWYESDKTQVIQAEFIDLIKNWKTQSHVSNQQNL